MQLGQKVFVIQRKEKVYKVVEAEIESIIRHRHNDTEYKVTIGAAYSDADAVYATRKEAEAALDQLIFSLMADFEKELRGTS